MKDHPCIVTRIYSKNFVQLPLEIQKFCTVCSVMCDESGLLEEGGNASQSEEEQEDNSLDALSGQLILQWQFHTLL